MNLKKREIKKETKINVNTHNRPSRLLNGNGKETITKRLNDKNAEKECTYVRKRGRRR